MFLRYFIMFFLFSFFQTSVFSYDLPCLNNRDFTQFDSLTMLYGDLAPSIHRAVRDVVNDYKVENQFSKKDKAHIVVEFPDQPPRVFGLSEKDVLAMDGDPNGAACSDDHIRNDMSNRWCHAIIVKVIQETLKKHGVPNIIASLAGASVFVVKEYGYDLKPSKPDLVLADVEIFKSKKGDKKVTFSAFGDGMFFINFEKKF